MKIPNELYTVILVNSWGDKVSEEGFDDIDESKEAMRKIIDIIEPGESIRFTVSEVMR